MVCSHDKQIDASYWQETSVFPFQASSQGYPHNWHLASAGVIQDSVETAMSYTLTFTLSIGHTGQLI